MSRASTLARAPAAQAPGLLLQRKCACGGNAAPGLKGQCPACERKKMLGLQTRTLRVGDAQDAFEQEADRVAQQVMGAPASARPRITPLPQTVQRAANDGAAIGAIPAAAQAALQGPAEPLDAATRQFFEPRFGHDFGRVRVHADGGAAASARAVQARAYTVGADIVFGAGQYMPGTSAGRHLLAHELAHVVQQQAVAPNPETLP